MILSVFWAKRLRSPAWSGTTAMPCDGARARSIGKAPPRLIAIASNKRYVYQQCQVAMINVRQRIPCFRSTPNMYELAKSQLPSDYRNWPGKS